MKSPACRKRVKRCKPSPCKPSPCKPSPCRCAQLCQYVATCRDVVATCQDFGATCRVVGATCQVVGATCRAVGATCLVVGSTCWGLLARVSLSREGKAGQAGEEGRRKGEGRGNKDVGDETRGCVREGGDEKIREAFSSAELKIGLELG